MAIEVLNRGTPPSQKVAQFVCFNCKSVLRARRSDGELKDSQRESYVEFLCPICGYACQVGTNQFKDPPPPSPPSPGRSEEDQANTYQS